MFKAKKVYFQFYEHKILILCLFQKLAYLMHDFELKTTVKIRGGDHMGSSSEKNCEKGGEGGILAFLGGNPQKGGRRRIFLFSGGFTGVSHVYYNEQFMIFVMYS